MLVKSKSIYIVRHGETDYNRQGIIQGSGVDASLNEWGRAQADAFFDAYQHVPFDMVYTSNLVRTQQSVQQFINSGVPFEKHTGLNEICWGIYEGNKPSSVDAESYTQLLNDWKEGKVHLSTIGGESPLDVSRRQQEFLTYILDKTEEETILIVTHGRAMRILLASFSDPHQLSGMDYFEHSNLCLYKVEYSYETNSFSIQLSNDITHLLTLEIPQTI